MKFDWRTTVVAACTREQRVGHLATVHAGLLPKVGWPPPGQRHRYSLENVMSAVIYFYLVDAPYGDFSNCVPFPILIDKALWPTSEHYFEAAKFLSTTHQDTIRTTVSPMTAARIGRDRTLPLRSDWDAVKDDVMRKSLYAKFTHHPELHELLSFTGDAKIVDPTRNDSYWADAGTGKNMLGILLMELRDILRNRGS